MTVVFKLNQIKQNPSKTKVFKLELGNDLDREMCRSRVDRPSQIPPKDEFRLDSGFLIAIRIFV